MASERAKLKLIIKDLEKIRIELLGDEKEGPAKKDFEYVKYELREGMNKLAADVEKLNDLEKNGGDKVVIIELRNSNRKSISKLKEMIGDMKKVLEKDEKKKKKDENEEKIFVNRKKMILLLWKELESYEQSNSYQSIKKYNQENKFDQLYSSSLSSARERREQRRRERNERSGRKSRDDGKNPDETEMVAVAPPSLQEQKFMEEVNVSMAEQDAMLDEILKGITELTEIAKDQQKELKIQINMTEDMEEKIDKTDAKIITANRRLKQIIEDSGGISAWCPRLICIIVIVVVGLMVWNQMDN
jgi:hypothetical protein